MCFGCDHRSDDDGCYSQLQQRQGSSRAALVLTIIESQLCGSGSGGDGDGEGYRIGSGGDDDYDDGGGDGATCFWISNILLLIIMLMTIAKQMAMTMMVMMMIMLVGVTMVGSTATPEQQLQKTKKPRCPVRSHRRHRELIGCGRSQLSPLQSPPTQACEKAFFVFDFLKISSTPPPTSFLKLLPSTKLHKESVRGRKEDSQTVGQSECKSERKGRQTEKEPATNDCMRAMTGS